MADKTIKSALISVYHKDGLDAIVQKLHELNVTIYSTGGTQAFIESLDIPVQRVEDLTSYPSILDGRVKTLHPKIFGGILARRKDDHLTQLEKYEIPEIDLVIVDLYPFEETVKSTDNESEIIEKIDIGGISLIRAAAKNFGDVVVIPSQESYEPFLNLLNDKQVLPIKLNENLLQRKLSKFLHTMIQQFLNTISKMNLRTYSRKACNKQKLFATERIHINKVSTTVKWILCLKNLEEKNCLLTT